MLMRCNAYFYACSKERVKELQTTKVVLAKIMEIQDFEQRYPEVVEKAVGKANAMVYANCCTNTADIYKSLISRKW